MCGRGGAGLSLRTVSAVMDGNDGFTVTQQEAYVGEHNADMLEITLNEEFSASDYDFLSLIFDVSGPGGCFASNTVIDADSFPVYREGNVIYCPLSQALTSTGTLSVQVAAHANANAGEPIIRKSGIFTLSLLPSLMGSGERSFDEGGYESKVRTAIERLRSGMFVMQFSVMPTASEELLGEIVQYSGADGGAYRAGYFYQCRSRGSSGAADYFWQQITVEPPYSLPRATAETLGGVKVDGSSITVGADGTISACSTGSGSVHERCAAVIAACNELYSHNRTIMMLMNHAGSPQGVSDSAEGEGDGVVTLMVESAVWGMTVDSENYCFYIPTASGNVRYFDFNTFENMVLPVTVGKAYRLKSAGYELPATFTEMTLEQIIAEL